MKHWMLRLYAPLFLLGFVAAAVAWIGHLHGDPLWLLALLAVAIAVSFAAERAWPYAPAFHHDHGDSLRDTLHALVNESLNLLSIAAVPLLAAIIPWQAWPLQWPFALQVLLAVICADLGITLVHYASHRIGWLWRLHAVHHSVTNVRSGPIVDVQPVNPFTFAAKVGCEPSLPNFCDAAKVCYHGGDKNVQQPLGF